VLINKKKERFMEKNTKLMYILAIFISWISSLIFFLNAKSENEKEEAKLSLNFEISYAIVAAVVYFVIGLIGGMIGFPAISFIVGIVIWAWHAFVDYKAMKASEEGKKAEFPFNFNLIK
jgi:uncharacterized Tic20 family protein